MEIFKKKFKVKVDYFAEDKYQVKYAHYRFIPIYEPLCFWFELSLTGSTERWTGKLFKIDEAERVAKSLKSIEDVEKWHEPHHRKREDFYRRKKEYYKKNVPYTTKKF